MFLQIQCGVWSYLPPDLSVISLNKCSPMGAISRAPEIVLSDTAIVAKHFICVYKGNVEAI